MWGQARPESKNIRCSTQGCQNDAASLSDRCPRCVLMRGQHAMSHYYEGHKNLDIVLCPICERLTNI